MLARCLGMTTENIRLLKNNDVLKPLGSSTNPTYDLAASVKAYIAYATKGIKPGDENVGQSLSQQKLYEEWRKLKLENDLKEGTSIPKDDAEFVVQEAFGMVISRVHAVPRRMQSKLTPETMRIMRDELDEAFAAGADRLARLGAIGDDRDDGPTPDDPDAGSVGERQPDNSNRKRRTRPVQK